MNNYLLRIELLSDLCVSDGGIYNSTIDTDICHDRFGFPYIPAKRIKGCLRECGLELADWDDNPSEFKKALDILFGTRGIRNGKATCRIGNAYLEDYERLVKNVQENESHPFSHPVTILNKYSYIRTQTALDYDTGVADDNSLRTIRVAKKGLVFLSCVELEEKDLFEKCCKIFRHMGIARTRGLGEIKATLEPTVVHSSKAVLNDEIAEESKYVLNYTIDLLEPMICKSVNAGEAETQDYIEGAKILGLVAGLLKEDGQSYFDFIKGEKLVFSNAYLTIKDRRSFEIPGYYYNIKDDKTKCVNKLFETGKTEDEKRDLQNKQLNQAKHGYMIVNGSEIVKKDVEIENHYHHRRPEDKSIGRAISKAGEEGSDFYQVASISSFQSFSGFIEGSSKQLMEIKRLLSSKEVFYLGYSANAEYGKVRISVSFAHKEPADNKGEVKKLLIRLNAPCIVYSDNAMVSTDARELEKEILCALHLYGNDDKGVEYDSKRFIRYVTTGGFNVTWGMRKPTVQTFDKGTAILFEFKGAGVNINAPSTLFIGERTTEGYGEIYIEPILNNGSYLWGFEDNNDMNNKVPLIMTEDNKKLFETIADDFVKSFVKDKAVCRANSFSFESSMKSTISNMLLLIEESNTISEIKKDVYERFDKTVGTKEEKLEYALKFIKVAEDGTKNVIAEFEKKYNVESYQPSIDIQMLYLETFLIHGKYRLREDNA